MQDKVGSGEPRVSKYAGRELQALRLERGLTAREVAARIGRSYGTVRQAEARPERHPVLVAELVDYLLRVRPVSQRRRAVSGQRLLDRRLALGWSAAELARRAGVKVWEVRGVERHGPRGRGEAARAMVGAMKEGGEGL